VRGEHRFDIDGYSQKQGVGAGNFLTSDTFAVGGFEWVIHFYPDEKDNNDEAFVSVFIRLVTPNATAWALFDLRLVDPATGQPRSVLRSREPEAFGDGKEQGARAFMARAELAASPYLGDDDRLTVECVLNVVQETRLSKTTAAPAIVDPPPPSDLWEHLAALLRTQVGADVTFAVEGEAFRAHRVVLAARSPVFKAELSASPPAAKEGEENAGETMAIDGMTPLVFKTQLHFIYTDTLPDMGDLGREEYQELVRNLRAAADRYAMGRLKRICTVILQKVLDAKTVAAQLDSTCQHHHCHALGDGCVQFTPSSGLEG
jgi:speckle-type POZ protein